MCMSFTPSDKILERYADVMVNFALGGGKGIKRGETVYLSVPDTAKPFYFALYRAIIKKGGNVISNYLPEGTQEQSSARDFYTHASAAQLSHFPKHYLKGLVDSIDHSLMIIADADPHELSGIDPKKIMRRGEVMKRYREWRTEKEHKGKLSWTLALYCTPALAHEAGLTEEEYWNQIIRACYLDEQNPIAKWKDTYKKLESYREKLNALSPDIDKLHVEGADADLWITLGEKRQWLCGSGANIPSFEIFTSPDKRYTEGWIRFDQPLYRYGNRIEGIELHFKKGKVVKSSARTNEKLLKEMIATPGANMVGEFSMTDTRFSRITKFMAETLYDENIGGPQGNSHIALGASYKDTFAGNVAKLTKAQAAKLGYNDSSVHTDIITTTRRTVTAHLKNGKKRVIYSDGKYTL